MTTTTVSAQPQSGWRITRVAADEQSALASFQRQASADQFHAAYFANPALAAQRLAWQMRVPGAATIFVIRHETQLAGQLAWTPVTLQVNSRRVSAAWGQDMLIAPAYRRRGAAWWLLRAALQDLRLSHDVLLVGGTNADSYPLFRAAGFHDIGWLPRAVGVTRMVRWLTSLGPSRDLTLQVCAAWDECIARWWHGRPGVHVVRDEPWLRWRFAAHPHWTYAAWHATCAGATTGYVIARTGRTRIGRALVRTCRIVELAADDAVTACSLLAQAARYGVERGCGLLRVDVWNERLPLASLRAAGLVPVRSQHRVLAFTRDAALQAALRESRARYMAGADSDFDLYEPA